MTEKTKKALKLPEAGQWPDRIAPTVLVAGAVLSTIGFLLAFLWASPVNGAAVNGVEMIGGQMDVETAWPNYVAEYEAAGAAELETMVNEAIATARAAA